MMRSILLFAAGIHASFILAGPCDFQTVGDARNGLQFHAQIRIPTLTVQSALGQLQQLALDGGYQVGNELIEGKVGEVSFIQAGNQPAVVVRAKADSEGRVSLSLKLARGQKVNPVDVQSEFCGMLAKLKTGKEGEVLAAAVRAKTGAGRIILAKAEKLSAEIGSEIKSTLAPVENKGRLSRFLIGAGTLATGGEFEEALAPIRAKYLGRKYQIDGQLYTVSYNNYSREMEFNFLVTPRRGLLGIKQDRQYNNLNFQIKCVMANDQAAFYSTLTEGNWVTISGTVTEFRADGMVLTGVRQAN